jgi:hypothetical protein
MNKEFKLGIRVLVANDGLSSDLMSKVMGGNDDGTVVPSCQCKAPNVFSCTCNAGSVFIYTPCYCNGNSKLVVSES